MLRPRGCESGDDNWVDVDDVAAAVVVIVDSRRDALGERVGLRMLERIEKVLGRKNELLSMNVQAAGVLPLCLSY